MTLSTAARPTLERRREHRVQVHLPILVRGTDNAGEKFEEHTTSVNLCRGGAAFATRYALDLGDRLQIDIPVVAPGGDPDKEFSTQGRIVHIVPGESERELIIGVEFTGPRFNHMFVSESTS
jgi:c-di-GMP-binding flagellar brake protein YcgR